MTSSNLSSLCRFRRASCLVVAWLAVATSAHSAVIPLIDYSAGNNPTAWAPLLYGWNDTTALGQPIAGYAYSVSGPQNGGETAWQIVNPASPGIDPHYFYDLEGATGTHPLAVAARQNGWSMQVTAQFVSTQQGDSNQGLSVHFDDRLFLVAVDQASTGALIAVVYTAPGESTTIPLQPASMSGAYYDYELRSDPATQDVTFYFEGEAMHAWPGVQGIHENKFSFGSVTDWGASTMNYREVYAHILDTSLTPTEQGDYNNDGVVNLADYSMWRDTLGSTTLLAADGNGNRFVDAGDYQLWKSNFGTAIDSASSSTEAAEIPEPSGLWLLASPMVASLVRKKRTGMRRTQTGPF